jgi:hypothetical protein
MAPLQASVHPFLFSHCILAVTVIPLTLTVLKPYESHMKPVLSGSYLLSRIIPSLNADGVFDKIPDTFWKKSSEGSIVYPSRDSFVRGSINAAAQHQHLIIQPDIVWLTALAQMNFYLRKNGEEKDVRSKFDNFQGDGLLHSLALAQPTMWFGLFIQTRIRTDWRVEWMRPKFTTSTQLDELVADVLMMASSNSSFEEVAPLICGFEIPSITLLGLKEDWELLLLKLNRLKEFGEQPARYGANLRPFLSRFAATFKDPNDQQIRQFWSDMITAKREQCSKNNTVSGSMNGFHYWDQAGNIFPESSGNRKDLGRIVLDDIEYPWRHRSNLPSAYYTFPLCWWADAPGFAKGASLAGLLGMSIRKGIPEGYAKAMHRPNFTLPPTVRDDQHSTLQPIHTWTTIAEPDPERPGKLKVTSALFPDRSRL